MDKAALVHKRRGKYMAQLMEAFEEKVEPVLDDPRADSVAEFKALARKLMNALASDAVELMSLGPDERLNGYAIDMTDRLHPHGRPTGARS